MKLLFGRLTIHRPVTMVSNIPEWIWKELVMTRSLDTIGTYPTRLMKHAEPTRLPTADTDLGFERINLHETVINTRPRRYDFRL